MSKQQLLSLKIKLAELDDAIVSITERISDLEWRLSGDDLPDEERTYIEAQRIRSIDKRKHLRADRLAAQISLMNLEAANDNEYP